MERRKRLALVLVALALASCGEGADESPAQARGTGPQPCASGGGSAVIDWSDFIRLDGVTYQANFYEKGLDRSEVGEPVAEVRCRISDNVTDPEYQLRDGDAAFLDPGTVIYSVKGYPESFRLTAEQDGRWVLFEPDDAPDAETGADLLAIEGKVRYLGINSSWNGTKELARIDDPAEVERLVAMVLSAPVDQERQFTDGDLDEQVFVEFHLEDGTRSIRAFGPDTGVLQRGILTPEPFGEAVRNALQQRS